MELCRLCNSSLIEPDTTGSHPQCSVDCAKPPPIHRTTTRLCRCHAGNGLREAQIAWPGAGETDRPLLCHLPCIEAGELRCVSRFSSPFSPRPGRG
jgi:hypothetical protein